MHHIRTSLRRAGWLGATMLLLLTLAAPTRATASATPPILQNDCGIGSDAGASWAAASSLAIPKVSCTGDLFSSLDPQDWYRFPVTSGQLITASMTPTAGSDFNLCLYNPSGSAAVCSSNTGSVTESLSYTATASGDWRLQVGIVSIPGDKYTMSVSAVSPQNDCGTGDDAGDTHATASTISLPKANCSAALVAVTDNEDWYQFAVTSGHRISARTTPLSGLTSDLCLFAPSGVQVGSCTSGTTIEQTATTTGNWRVRARIVSGSGTYFMTVSTLAPQNDCGTGNDAGNTHATASTITLPKTSCTAALAPVADQVDFYQFAVTAGQMIHATVTPNAGADYTVCLNTPSGGDAGACTKGGYGTPGLISYQSSVSGNWRLRVVITGGGGSYTMSVWNTTPSDDCGLGVDAGASHATATTVALPKTNCIGYLTPSSDTSDWYKFNVTSGESIRAGLLPNANASIAVCIYDPGGNLVAPSLCLTGGQGHVVSALHTATLSGEYRVYVAGISGSSGAYLLSIAKKTGSPATSRDDDNELDTFAEFDFSDDVATKRLPLTSGQLSGVTTATLFVYGKSFDCSSSGVRFRVTANNVPVDDLAPCDVWSSSQYQWRQFSVPVSALTSGTNTFSLSHIGGDSFEEGVQLGVDLDTDFGRSDIAVNNTSVGGELMWYVVLF